MTISKHPLKRDFESHLDTPPVKRGNFFVEFSKSNKSSSSQSVMGRPKMRLNRKSGAPAKKVNYIALTTVLHNYIFSLLITCFLIIRVDDIPIKSSIPVSWFYMALERVILSGATSNCREPAIAILHGVKHFCTKRFQANAVQEL